jgi:hypothetical protein
VTLCAYTCMAVLPPMPWHNINPFVTSPLRHVQSNARRSAAYQAVLVSPPFNRSFARASNADTPGVCVWGGVNSVHKQATQHTTCLGRHDPTEPARLP